MVTSSFTKKYCYRNYFNNDNKSSKKKVTSFRGGQTNKRIKSVVIFAVHGILDTRMNYVRYFRPFSFFSSFFLFLLFIFKV